MTQAERAASAVNDRNVVWIGNEVTAEAPGVLGPRPSVKVLQPPTAKGSIEAQPATFGEPLNGGGGVSGKVVLADDATGATADACEPLVNNVHGKVVLVDRGACAFVVKVAQRAGGGRQGRHRGQQRGQRPARHGRHGPEHHHPLGGHQPGGRRCPEGRDLELSTSS